MYIKNKDPSVKGLIEMGDEALLQTGSTSWNFSFESTIFFSFYAWIR